MSSVCIYGTVFNNIETVEASIKSVWRPDAELVVVDSYSTDGTWEKLLELKKDLNLRVYRYRSTRGLGRQIALRKCPESSLTVWFDLDTIYNEAFHGVMDYAIQSRLTVHAGPLFAKRELILSKGGWRDLNYGEDVELVSRVGFDVHVPVILGKNAERGYAMHTREWKYGGFRRVVKSSVDLLRGHAISFERILINKSKRAIAFYPLARLMGFYRNRRPDNPSWIDLAILVKAIPPRDAGIPEDFFSLIATSYTVKRVLGGEKTIDELVSTLVHRPVYKARSKSREIVLWYFKNFKWTSREYLPLVAEVTVV